MNTTSRSEPPATTQPWPRMSAAGRDPSADARFWAIAMEVTSRLVSPNEARESQTGTSGPIDAHMCMIGRSGTPVTPKGITPGLWL